MVNDEYGRLLDDFDDIEEDFAPFDDLIDCFGCDGSGKVGSETCWRCYGEGQIEAREDLS